MAGSFHLQIVTPEREVYSGTVEQVTLPGAEASFGVLRNHAPLIAALQAGVIDIFDESNHEMRIVIGGGFFQVAANKAIVLADSAESPAEIDAERAQASEQRARTRLAGSGDAGMQVQRDRADAALKRARVRLKNASGAGPGQG
jgi:F-type H+-transporting ATPase subunit epsilon